MIYDILIIFTGNSYTKILDPSEFVNSNDLYDMKYVYICITSCDSINHQSTKTRNCLFIIEIIGLFIDFKSNLI